MSVQRCQNVEEFPCVWGVVAFWERRTPNNYRVFPTLPEPPGGWTPEPVYPELTDIVDPALFRTRKRHGPLSAKRLLEKLMTAKPDLTYIELLRYQPLALYALSEGNFREGAIKFMCKRLRSMNLPVPPGWETATPNG